MLREIVRPFAARRREPSRGTSIHCARDAIRIYDHASGEPVVPRQNANELPPPRSQPRHRFRSRPGDPTKQAAGIVKRLQGSRIRSVGTARNYQERLVQIAARLGVALTALTPERAVAYLKGRAAEVGQKTLDMER